MNQSLPEKGASIQQALAYLKRERPLRAEEVCRDYLAVHPGCADHIRLLGQALMI